MDVHFCSLLCVSSAACLTCWSHQSCGLVAAWADLPQWLLRSLLEPLCLLEPAPTCSCALAKQGAIFRLLFSGWKPADSSCWNGFVQVLMNTEAGKRERVGTCSQREVRDYASQESVWLRLLWNWDQLEFYSCGVWFIEGLVVWLVFLLDWDGDFFAGLISCISLLRQ